MSECSTGIKVCTTEATSDGRRFHLEDNNEMKEQTDILDIGWRLESAQKTN